MHHISECISCLPCRLCKCKYVIAFPFGNFNIKSVKKNPQFLHSLLINCNQVSWECFMAVCVMHKRWLWLTEARLCIYMYTSHCNDVIMSATASQITSLTIVYSTVYSGTDHRKHQSSASLAFVRGIHRWPGNSPHKWPVTRKMFPFDDVIIVNCWSANCSASSRYMNRLNQNKFSFHKNKFRW